MEIALNAYGWSGPWAGRRGFDSLVQMSTGIAHAGTAHFGADIPRPLPVQALDHATGYLAAAAALRAWQQRLDGRVSSARLSLARTAAELQGTARGRAPDGETAPEFAAQAFAAPAGPAEAGPLDQPVLDRTEEQTFWGPGLRLAPPVRFEGTGPQPQLHWDIPAGPLGSAAAGW